MKRTIDAFLLKWKDKKRRRPLIVRGARQVGKSFSIREVGQDAFENLVELNLEQHPNLSECFSDLDPARIVDRIEIVTGQSIKPGKTLLFLDEIQATPNAIPALRYFFEEMPRLPVVAAGSLMEFALADHAWSMPVGRIEYLYMGPLSFEEFLAARQEDRLLDYIRLHTPDQTPSLAAHERLLLLLREYLLVGGMPEAADTFAQAQVKEQFCN